MSKPLGRRSHVHPGRENEHGMKRKNEKNYIRQILSLYCQWRPHSTHRGASLESYDHRPASWMTSDCEIELCGIRNKRLLLSLGNTTKSCTWGEPIAIVATWNIDSSSISEVICHPPAHMHMAVYCSLQNPRNSHQHEHSRSDPHPMRLYFWMCRMFNR